MIEEIINTDWSEILDVTFRGILALISLFLVTKMLGKKQISQLSLFDYVIGISIGNFAAEMTINLESQYLNGIVAVLIFGSVAYLVSILIMKSIRLRKFLMGVPTILIQDGKILQKNLSKIKVDINDMLEECRTSGYFDLSEISYAIMEPNGKVSILPKWKYKSVTTGDLDIKGYKQGLCANIIIDGKLLKENLENMNKTEKWFENEVNSQGYKDYKEILLATLDERDNVVIYERNLNQKPKEVLE